MKKLVILFALAGCDRLGPRVEDLTVDAPATDGTLAPDTPPGGPKFVLPAGATVPHSKDNAGLLAQIRLNDGLSDNQLANNNGVLARSTGKSGGAAVSFWNFGAAQVTGNFAVVSPVYQLVETDGVTPIDHPLLLDSVPGDSRYSQVRRIVLVPITASYAGELVTSTDALAEAIDLGLVGEPIAAGTWRSLPVVPHDTLLEVGTVEPVAPTEVYANGHIVTAFPLGGAFAIQPLRNGGVPIGQESRLVSGVATGTPPVMPTTADPQPVFQYTIPTAAPTTAPNYTPLSAQVDVRLAAGVAPADVTSDAQVFRRNPAVTGSINGFLTDTVDSFTITTTVTFRHIQFEEGQP